jgi:hypothetical protein
MKTLLLIATLSLPSLPAQADESCRPFLLRVRNAVQKIEALDASLGNVRKNLSARISPPAELKAFDVALFEEERARIEIESGTETTPEEAGETGALRFETKLAHLEVAIQKVNDQRPGFLEMLGALPPYKKKRLVNAVNALFSGSAAITETAVQYRIGDLYLDLLNWHYPRLLDGADAAAREATLKATLEARLVSRNVTKTLRDAGLLNTEPGVFRRNFQSLLRGQTVQYLLNAQGNITVIQGALSSQLIPYWILPPSIRFSRWIEIPENLLLLAEEQGLEKIWKEQIQPDLMRRYGAMTRFDLVYSRLQKIWSGATYYAFMGWLAFTLTWSVPGEVKIKIQQREIQNAFETVKSVPKEQEKAVLLDNEKQVKWETWLKSHPEAAANPSSPEYQLMRRILFAPNTPNPPDSGSLLK